MKLLLLYASRYGQTAKVMRRIAAVIEQEGVGCTVATVDDAPPLHEFNDVVVAGAIYFGRHDRRVRRYVHRHLHELEERHTALVTICGDTALAPLFLEKFSAATGWQPDVAATFAGAVRYSRYGWLTRMIMRRAAARAGRPTEGEHEYTDWNAVEEFARAFVSEARRRAA